MYVSGDDFYFFTYSIFIILDVLKCINERTFRDYRKLPFLVEFVRDKNLIYILESSTRSDTQDVTDGMNNGAPLSRKLNNVDKEYLFRSYSNGIARRSEMLKLLFTLEKSGYVGLSKGDIDSMVNVTLIKHALPPDFLSKKVFGQEFENMQKLKLIVKRLSSLTQETMLERLYENQGVKTWAL